MAGDLTRREFMGGLARLLASALVPQIAEGRTDNPRGQLDQARRDPFLVSNSREHGNDLDSMVLFSDAYCEHGPKPLRDTVTILYPGSGADTSVLELGIQLLNNTPVKKVNFIFTEIGGCSSIGIPGSYIWHDGREDVLGSLFQVFPQNLPQVFRDVVMSPASDTGWENRDIAHSSVTRFDAPVDTPLGEKSMTLYLAYNTFSDRSEPTEEERAFLSKKLLKTARDDYWPVKKDKGRIYPTYFLQSQFDRADVVISKRCGNIALLWVDCARAFNATDAAAPKVLLAESMLLDVAGYPGKMILPGDCRIERHVVEEESSFGYCGGTRDTSRVIGCSADLVVVSRDGFYTPNSFYTH
jgi:hypothetical protein